MAHSKREREIIEELRGFLKTLNLCNKELDACFYDAVAAYHIEGLFFKALSTQKQEFKRVVKKVISRGISPKDDMWVRKQIWANSEREMLIAYESMAYQIGKFNQVLTDILKAIEKL